MPCQTTLASGRGRCGRSSSEASGRGSTEDAGKRRVYYGWRSMEVQSPAQARMMAISKPLKILGHPLDGAGKNPPWKERFVSLSSWTVNSYRDDG